MGAFTLRRPAGGAQLRGPDTLRGEPDPSGLTLTLQLRGLVGDHVLRGLVGDHPLRALVAVRQASQVVLAHQHPTPVPSRTLTATVEA